MISCQCDKLNRDTLLIICLQKMYEVCKQAVVTLLVTCVLVNRLLIEAQLNET